MEEILRIEQLNFTYSMESEPVLKNLSLSIGTGEFLVLCGGSGCGKTTLLKQLKPELAPYGTLKGQIYFHNQLLKELFPADTTRIGYVGQNPEDGIVTDKVWHELAFGLESLGMKNEIIRKRVAEMSQFFGIQSWFHQDTDSLSGGQKQLLNLASVMVMQPDILLLDEPTSQMDPIAATEFLTILGRIYRELGTTIVLTEHRLEEVLGYCTRMLIMEAGAIRLDGSPADVAQQLGTEGAMLYEAMPAPVRLFRALDGQGKCPLSVGEGRNWFDGYWEKHSSECIHIKDVWDTGKRKCAKGSGFGVEAPALIRLQNLYFRYEKQGREILQNLSLDIHRGELLAIMGGNGSGKTTLLSLLTGSRQAQKGKIRYPEKQAPRLVLLPQNPQLLFIEETVKKELEDMVDRRKPESVERMQALVRLCRLEGLLARHPYDISGGEQQRLALAKVLMTEPELLLMDEPTKGLDAGFKKLFAEILENLKARGCTIVMVSHDVEFCAEYADRCVLMFDGQLVADGTATEFFAENHFYTTTTNRMVRTHLPKAITVEDVLRAFDKKESNKEGIGRKESGQERVERKESEQGETGKRESGQEGVEGKESEQGEIGKKESAQEEAERKESEQGETGKKESEQEGTENTRTENRNHSIIAGVGTKFLFLLIPVTIYLGVHIFDNQKYLFIALLVLLECMIPFFVGFEGKKPPVSKVVLLSVLCAIGVAGRAAFAMLPQFKPVTAITIIAGAVFGGEAGFLVGAVTMLVSNMLFGQGPWTPWQMAAMGLVGMLAGVLFSRTTRPNVVLLCIYGFLAAVIIYGGIMNPASALMAGVPIDLSVLIAYWVSGFPLDLVHGVATILFLAVGALPLIKKLERAKLKFGL